MSAPDINLILDRHRDTSAARIAAWSAIMSASGRIAVEAADVDRFEGEFRSRTFGDIRVMRVRSTRFRLERDARMAAGMARDHLLVNVLETGGIQGRIAARAIRAEAGSLILSRMTSPMDVVIDDATWLALIVPIDVLDLHMTWRRSLDARVFSAQSVQTALLAGHVRSLLALPDLKSAHETGLIARATLALLVASLAGPSRRAPAGTAQTGKVASQVRRFILQHLREPDLGVERICREFALSRSSLYRLMGERSDIAALIRGLRLHAAQRDILSGRLSHLPVGEIGRRWGLSDERNFRRAFVREFGQSPSHLRRSLNAAVPDALQASLSVEEELERWFSGL